MSERSAEKGAGRLTRLAPDLWLDLDTVVSVQTRTRRSTYARVVILTTTQGATYEVVVPGTANSGCRAVSVGDRLLDEWIAENLASVIPPAAPEEPT